MNRYDVDHVDDPPASEPELAELFYKHHAAGEMIEEKVLGYLCPPQDECEICLAKASK